MNLLLLKLKLPAGTRTQNHLQNNTFQLNQQHLLPYRTKKAFKINDFEGFIFSSEPYGTKLEPFTGRFEVVGRPIGCLIRRFNLIPA